MVTCNLFRTPSYLAKISSTIDVMSNGRLEFGIGAGWHEEECTGFGIPFPSARERIDRLGEALQVIEKMWSEETTNFSGRYYQLDGAVNYPKPLQKPHPPVWIGGNGKRLLKLVAAHADRWNPNCPIAVFPEKLQLFREACETVGRDFGSIEKTYALNTLVGDDVKTGTLLRKIEEEHLLFDFEAGMVGTPEVCVKTLQNLRDMGVTYFIFILPNVSEVEPLRILAKEVIPRVL
ncbi:MAG: LLM class flavin-dependent oxidoreductase [Thaumarchaeota archaeon]|nr:LLM class flavin-dependent oxidoreductase [Nitrososphaerota archaeon]